LRTMLKACAPVAAVIIEERFNKSEMAFRNGASVTISWGSSIAATGSTPFGMVIIDEADKPGYDVVGKEGSALGRIRERFVTYADYKLLIFSTPTLESGNITKELEKCPTIARPFVPCPMCGAMQPMFWRPTEYVGMDGEKHKSGYVYFDNELADNQAKADSARYECGECKGRWDTVQKNEALAACKPYPWRIMPRMGFDNLSRMYSLFQGGRLETMVMTWLDAQADVLDLQTYINSILGECWRRHKITHSEDELRKAETALPFGIVPDAADCLVATIDMQQTGFWYLVRGWQAALKQSWLIECGQIGTWEDVSDLLFSRTWSRENGSVLGIWRSGIDTGGTKEDGALVSRTEEAYSWWIENYGNTRQRAFLCKGSSRSLPSKIKIGKVLETMPSGRQINRYGMQIVEMNTPVLKRLFLHGIKQAMEGGSGAAHLHAEMPPQYYRHITAEAEDDSGNFVRLRPDNHWLDCEATQYGLISRELSGGVDQLARSHQVAPPSTPAQPPQPKQPNPYTAGRTDTGVNPYTRR
jgi:terminase, large subunit